MATYKVILLYSCFLCFVMCMCCKTKPVEKWSVNKYPFSLKLTKGVKYSYSISNETSMKLEVNDQEVNSSNWSILDLVYQVLDDSADTYLLKVNYDKLHLFTKGPQGEEQINVGSASMSSNPLETLLSGLIGSPLDILINQKGEILSIQGAQELSEKIIAASNEMDAQSAKFIKERVRQLIGDDFVRSTLGSTFKLFPDTAIIVGDSWTLTNTQSGDIQYSSALKYTLTSVSDGVANIDVRAEIKGLDNNPSIIGNNVTTSLTGSQNGDLQAEISTGLLLKTRTEVELHGSITTMGREVPVEIKITRFITRKQIQ